MQFIVLAFDAEDAEALQRRHDTRDAHLEKVKQCAEAGNQHMGAAIINDAGDMHGSLMIFDFPSRQDLDAWLEQEPYIKGNVWDKIQVLNCKIAPIFQ